MSQFSEKSIYILYFFHTFNFFVWLKYFFVRLTYFFVRFFFISITRQQTTVVCRKKSFFFLWSLNEATKFLKGATVCKKKKIIFYSSANNYCLILKKIKRILGDWLCSASELLLLLLDLIWFSILSKTNVIFTMMTRRFWSFMTR